MEEIPVQPDDEVSLVVIDIFRESELAGEYQGFELIIYIVARIRERINKLIQNDPIASELATKKQLMFFDSPVGEHLLLATVNVPRDYLLIFLEEIRNFWQKEAGDAFTWKGVDIDVALQVGICRFKDLARYQRELAFQIMSYHLRRLVNQIYERDEKSEQPLNHVLEYNAVVRTEKAHE